MGYISFHNSENIPSAVPRDEHGRCGRSEYVTNDIFVITHAKVITNPSALVAPYSYPLELNIVALASKWYGKTAVVSIIVVYAK